MNVIDSPLSAVNFPVHHILKYAVFLETPTDGTMTRLGVQKPALLAAFQSGADAKRYAYALASSGDYQSSATFTVPSLGLAYPAMG